jgi:hypothetical protein
MADGDNQQLVKLVVLGGAGFAAYKFLYEPWQQKKMLDEEIQRQTQANLAKGMTLADASTAAVSGACQAVAAFYKIPPDKSGGVCHGIGALATYTTQLTIKALGKGAKAVGKAATVVGHDVAVAGRAVGHTVATGAKAVGHTAAVLGKGVGKGASTVAKVAKFTHYTAPKKAVTTVAKVIKFTHYTAPKKAVKAVASVTKSVAKSVAHGFGLWGLDVDATPPGRTRRSSMGPLGAAVRRQARGDLAPGGKRRGLAGVPAGSRRRSAGASFYTKHLR